MGARAVAVVGDSSARVSAIRWRSMAAKFYDAFLGELLPRTSPNWRFRFTRDRDRSARARGHVFTAGPLRPAVAAAMAIPGLVRPVEDDGRVLVDGGAVDPLPSGACAARLTSIVAVDVSGGAEERSAARSVGKPDGNDLGDGSHHRGSQAEGGAPDLVLRPNIGIFRMLDFFQASAILRAAEPIKAEVKTRLGAILS